MPGLNPFNIQAMTANKGIDFVSKDKQSMAIKGKAPVKKTVIQPLKSNGQKKKR